MPHIRTVIIEAGGAGTKEDPKVTWRLIPGAENLITEARRKGCAAIAAKTARALEFTHVKLRSWNSPTAYAIGADGRRIFQTDDATGKRRPVIIPADSHFSAMFWRGGGGERNVYRGNVYTVDDADMVPRRLMPIGERRHASEHDRQSPQLYPVGVYGHRRRHPTHDALDEFIRSQWADELILFDVDNRVDLDEHQRVIDYERAVQRG